MNQRLDKWLRWFDTFDKEIIKLVFYNHLFWEVQDIIGNNKEIQKPSAFYDYLGDSFIAYSVMAVRRQVKIKKDNSISFARLLHEMKETPEVLSRKWFISLYSNDSWANRDFDKFCGIGENKDYLDPIKVEKDLVELQSKAQNLEDLADKRIAHRDICELKSIPTYKELKDCINFLDKLLCKYYLLFQAKAVDSSIPTVQYDWKVIFNSPWLGKSQMKE